jgi:hypothetical protein
MPKKETKWMKHLMKVYHELQRKDKNTKYGDAMKIAKRSYKP